MARSRGPSPIPGAPYRQVPQHLSVRTVRPPALRRRAPPRRHLRRPTLTPEPGRRHRDRPVHRCAPLRRQLPRLPAGPRRALPGARAAAHEPFAMRSTASMRGRRDARSPCTIRRLRRLGRVPDMLRASSAAVSAVSASRPMRRKPLYARRRCGSAAAGSSATNSTMPANWSTSSNACRIPSSVSERLAESIS